MAGYGATLVPSVTDDWEARRQAVQVGFGLTSVVARGVGPFGGRAESLGVPWKPCGLWSATVQVGEDSPGGSGAIRAARCLGGLREAADASESSRGHGGGGGGGRGSRTAGGAGERRGAVHAGHDAKALGAG